MAEVEEAGGQDQSSHEAHLTVPPTGSDRSAIRFPEEAFSHRQLPAFAGLEAPPMMPMFFPGLGNSPSTEEQNQGPGIYAVPYNPFPGLFTGYPLTTLIPVNYKIPARGSLGGASEAQGNDGRPQQGQRPVAIRRFQIELQLDLALMMKLAAFVFLFSQDGSNQRLLLLVLIAASVYLYQTGLLTPLIRYIQQATAPRRHQPAVARAEDLLPAQHNEANDPLIGQNPGENQDANGNPRVRNQALPPVNENHPEPVGNRMGLLAFLKEVQTFFIGFVASLFPGFEHND